MDVEERLLEHLQAEALTKGTETAVRDYKTQLDSIKSHESAAAMQTDQKESVESTPTATEPRSAETQVEAETQVPATPATPSRESEPGKATAEELTLAFQSQHIMCNWVHINMLPVVAHYLLLFTACAQELRCT